jgi:hypothetical protein
VARPSRRSVLLGLAFLAALALSASAQPNPRAPETPTRIEVRARSITSFEPGNPARTRFGDLIFRGGLELTSPYQHFGGLSSLRVKPDGSSFLSISDKGYWLRGRILYEGTIPVGIADAEMAPALGPDGKSLASRGWFDTESIAESGEGIVWVGIERVNRIVRFDMRDGGLTARGTPIPVPEGIKTLPYNKGIECLVYAPPGMPAGGTLIAISERGLDSDGNIRGFLIGWSGPGEFSVKRIGDFDVSDCAITPDGELLILERSFSRAAGVGMRIRRVPLASVKPGALLDGPALFTADMNYQIDNMEGLSVHRAADGALVLTMISDDNFSMFQRTLLLQFTLADQK